MVSEFYRPLKIDILIRYIQVKLDIIRHHENQILQSKKPISRVAISSQSMLFFKYMIYIIMKRFCTSLHGDEVQTALVVGQGYLLKHSANERSHSHKR